ncbi:hypothetical protein Aab01nite_62420 [Paractinoplanes abujensis]|uniref:Integral membrane protein n=1 Tax=Paractinoplanes abujensis TaxID=882441 RepID=A0A7W7CQH8_9ACTN|nr:hypothetical protein [Actinoplanes abujensis]MBB4692847.1 hypothetical protein [Actinoplanes abujensis]GID22652.1 hypothetical protein Aab01nite_62420 [Actinoplanes abujensis]
MRVRADGAAATAALGLFAVAAVTGVVLYLHGRPVQAGAAPLFAHWRPHLGPGTPAAVLVAGLVVGRGPALAARLSWRRLTLGAYGVAVAWSLSLALVDGWSRGVADRLTTRHEYLHEVAGVTDVPAMLREFTSRILDGSTDSWTTHVSGHPPGALLTFVALDRVGLSGGGWAGLVCVAAGALTAVAVPHTVRLLGADDAARAAVPFAVLFPGAVWAGVSADGVFAGVTATGIALLAHALTRGARTSAVTAGLLLGFGCYLSYGLVLMVFVVAAVLIAAGLPWRPLPWVPAGAAAVVVVFTAYGFWWLDGYHLVVRRYYQGIAAVRPYAYWVWANLAVLAVAAGPVAAVILRRAVRAVTGPRRATWLLPLGATAAIVAADLSGYSKAEVERIWLPFAWWLTAGAALIPADRRRFWLGAQAVTALAVNHLLLTTW